MDACTVAAMMDWVSWLHGPQAQARELGLSGERTAVLTGGLFLLCACFQLAVRLHRPLEDVCASLRAAPATSRKLPSAGSSD